MKTLLLIDKTISNIDRCISINPNTIAKSTHVDEYDDFPRIVLWCVGRSLSTAFVRIMMEIKPQGKIFNEAFAIPFCFGRDRAIHVPTKNESNTTNFKQHIDTKFSDVVDCLNVSTKDYRNQGYSFLFCKEIPFTLQRQDYPNYLQYLLKHKLTYPKFKHTFLIRNPWKVAVSRHKIIVKGLLPNFDTFNHEKINVLFGFNELLKCYNQCIKLGYKNCIIIDSDDLLLKPKYIMKKYCQYVGLGKYYNDNILKWEPANEKGNVYIFKHFEIFKEWHQSLLNSNGLIVKTKQEIDQDTDNAKQFAKQKLCKKLLSAVEANMDAYQKLYQQRLM